MGTLSFNMLSGFYADAHGKLSQLFNVVCRGVQSLIKKTVKLFLDILEARLRQSPI